MAFQNQGMHSTDGTCLRIGATVSVGLSVGGLVQSDDDDDDEVARWARKGVCLETAVSMAATWSHPCTPAVCQRNPIVRTSPSIIQYSCTPQPTHRHRARDCQIRGARGKNQISKRDQRKQPMDPRVRSPLSRRKCGNCQNLQD